jgi:hypothetical protein
VPRFSDLFGGSDRFFAQLGASLLKYLLLGATMLPTLIVVVVALVVNGPEAQLDPVADVALANLAATTWVALGLVFTDVVVAVERRGPAAALRRSMELAAGHRMDLFLFLLLSGALSIAVAVPGAFLFGIGLLVTVPIAVALNEHAFVHAYARALGLRPVADPNPDAQAGVQSASSPWDAPPS